jgi:hypothetical protein
MVFLGSPKVLIQEDLKFFDLDFARCIKSSFLHFKIFNLAIYVVSFFETSSIHYFDSLMTDLVIGS